MLLFGLVYVINHTLSNWSWQFTFTFSIKCTYTIGHVVVLSHFCHRPHPIWSTMKVQFYFRCRSHYTISHVVSCLIFIGEHILSDGSWKFSFVFDVKQSYMIDHVVVLYGLHHRLHLIQSVMRVLFHFWCRLHLYDWSHHCPGSFLS